MATILTSRQEAPSADANWFGVAGPVAAWFGLGLGDMFITWRACVNQEQFGGASAHPAARVLYFVTTFVLFGVAILAGSVCYRKWKQFAGIAKLSRAEGRESSEFLALAGMFMSLTLGTGIVWLCLPLFVLQMCLRVR